tara:strand:+ start:39071 stop:40039 length:969 start_codon:yes stop_codon:yes gene_type:complete
MPESPQAILVLPHLRIQAANMVSSPMTWGFPAPSGFAGFTHALSRKIAKRYDLELGGVGIVCHKFEPQVSRPPGKYTNVLCLTRNPVKKDGKTASIVEEGRVHLEVTLVVGARGEALWEHDLNSLAMELYEMALAMRVAGGSILPPLTRRYKPEFVEWPEDSEGIESETRKLRRKLLPGFALVERQDILEERKAELASSNDKTTTLDALLDLCRMNFAPDPKTAAADEVSWKMVRRRSGWLVPIPLGFAAISEVYQPGEVANTRDTSTPFRFAEATLGIGEWLSPHRIQNMESLLWHYQADTEDGLYGCRNNYTNIELGKKD